MVNYDSSHGRSGSHGKNHWEKSRSKSRPRRDINDIECYYCHKNEHYQYHCKKLKIS